MSCHRVLGCVQMLENITELLLIVVDMFEELAVEEGGEVWGGRGRRLIRSHYPVITCVPRL